MRILVTILFLFSVFSVSAQKVYRTPSGEKYHTATCRYVKNVSNGLDIKDAIDMGLTACSQCNPNRKATIRNTSTSSSGLGIKSGEAQGSRIESVQCKGTTKQGLRCKHKTKNVNGYCHQHEPK